MPLDASIFFLRHLYLHSNADNSLLAVRKVIPN